MEPQVKPVNPQPSAVEEQLRRHLADWQQLKATLEADTDPTPDTENDIVYCDAKMIELENEIALLR